MTVRQIPSVFQLVQDTKRSCDADSRLALLCNNANYSTGNLVSRYTVSLGTRRAYSSSTVSRPDGQMVSTDYGATRNTRHPMCMKW